VGCHRGVEGNGQRRGVHCVYVGVLASVGQLWEMMTILCCHKAALGAGGGGARPRPRLPCGKKFYF
jgi:hypothetical protein